MEYLDTNDLVGLEVKNALVNPSNDVVLLETDKGNFYLSWYGDCCANCFLANFNGIDSLIGSTILEVNHSEWTNLSNDDDYEVVDSMGTNIKTTKGYVSFETRVSHNGYYGGSINITKDSVNEYGKEVKPSELKQLTDF